MLRRKMMASRPREEDQEEPMLETSPLLKVDREVVRRESRSYNKSYRGLRNLLMFLNSSVCLVLFVVSMELVWDGSREQLSASSDALRLTVIALSAVHILQALEYHSFRAKRYLRLLGSRGRRGGMLRMTRSDTCGEFWSFRMLKVLVVEVLVILPLPLPFLNGWAGWLGLGLWIRWLYWAVRVYRDHSSLSRAQDALRKKPNHYRSSFLSIKALFYQHPVLTLIGTVISGMFMFGYAIFIVERTTQPQVFNFGDSLYLSFAIIVTGWASDVFDEVDPQNPVTKAVCLAAMSFGLLVFALLLELVHEAFLPTKLEERAVLALARNDLQSRKEEAAARVIQTWWRYEIGPDDDRLERWQLKRLLRLRIAFNDLLLEEESFLADKGMDVETESKGAAIPEDKLGELSEQVSQMSRMLGMLETSLAQLRKKQKKTMKRAKQARRNQLIQVVDQ